LEKKLAEREAELARVGDILSANSETEGSNKVSLLDRDVELADRFVGETREQVLEVIKEARDKAEAEGRIRRAQVLEGVLVANEPTGELANKRAALEKFFNDNANILSGPVIAELERCGISYKNGEEYLKGYATTGSANKNDVNEDYYLIITIGENSLYFIDTLD
jgi:hypothetical protein